MVMDSHRMYSNSSSNGGSGCGNANTDFNS